MKKNIFLLSAQVVLCMLILCFAGCKQCNETKEIAPPVAETKKPVTVNAPPFNSDSAYAYTEKQLAFGPRNMNSKMHEECGKWLIEKMRSLADTVYVQKFEEKGFDGVNLKGTNIIASFNPQATTRVLLCSHWDSRPWADQDKVNRDKPILSASDGASGVATLIEIARAMRAQRPNIGVDLFLNDAEDYGYSNSLKGLVKAETETENSFCVGTQYWCDHPVPAAYKADFGILLDMAGAHNPTFAREAGSNYNAGWVLDKVWANAAHLGYGNMFVNQAGGEITDDHYYINTMAKIPTIDIIQYDNSTPTGFASYWHTHNDNMSIIDKVTLDAVGRTLLYTVYQYDAEQNAPK